VEPNSRFDFPRRTFLGGGLATVLLAAAGDALNAPRAEADEIHPRLIVTGSFFEDLRARAATDKRIGTTASVLIFQAKALSDISTNPLPSYGVSDGVRMLEQARSVLDRTYKLIFAYHFAADEATKAQLGERLWKELEAAGNFPDWNNTRHLLDTAELSHAFAVAYDWMYPYWSPERRVFLQTALLQKALRPAAALYSSGTAGTFLEDGTNRTLVTNAGFGLGSLAVQGDVTDSATVQYVLDNAVSRLSAGAGQLAPDGGFAEGLAYFVYGVGYLATFMAALRSVTGGYRGLDSIVGLSDSGLMPIHLTSPSGDTSFNFGDAGEQSSRYRSPELHALGAIFDRPLYDWYSEYDTPAEAEIVDTKALLWYQPEAVTVNPVSGTLPLDRSLLNGQVVSMRQSWEQPLAAWVAIKAGTPASSHGDADSGHFVFSARGQQWALDLGIENYDLPGMGSATAETVNRFFYYRKKAEGHNTLVFNPRPGPDQVAKSATKYTTSIFTPEEGIAIADLSSAQSVVTKWLRGFRLFDQRRQLLVEDEVSSGSVFEVWWLMHTKAVITIAADGKSATLSRGDQKLLARIVGDAGQFVDLPAEPMPSMSNPDGQTTNDDVRRLAIQYSGRSEYRIAVQLTPVRTGMTNAAAVVPRPLQEWSSNLPSGAPARATSVSVNSKKLASFRSDTYSYELEVAIGGGLPKLAATGASVTVVQPTSVPGTGRVTAKESGRSTTDYVFNFTRGSHAISGVKQISSDSGHDVSNTIDATNASAFERNRADAWLQYDIGGQKTIGSVSVDWFPSESSQYGDPATIRSTVFEILVSPDELSWSKVYSGKSTSSTRSSEENYAFTAVVGRFVRLLMRSTEINSIVTTKHKVRDVRIFDRAVPMAVTPDYGALSFSAAAGSKTIAVGETTTIAVSVESRAPSAKMVTEYSTSDPTVAKVSSSGEVLGIARGEATIGVIRRSPERRCTWSRVAVTVADSSVHIVPVAGDAHVDRGNPTTNYQTSTSLAVKYRKNDPARNREAYLRFDLAAVSGNIIGARLRFVGGTLDAEPTAVVTAHAITGEWDPSTVTWSTKPAIGPALGSTTLDADLNVQRVIDVSTHFTQQAGMLEASFALTEDNPPGGLGMAVFIKSKENVTAPVLELDVEPSKESRLSAAVDTYVEEVAGSGRDRSGETTLRVNTATASRGALEAYLRFALPPDLQLETIATATLFVSARRSAAGGQSVVAVSSSENFTQGGIDWNRRPAIIAEIARGGVVYEERWIRADVTSQLKSAVESGTGAVCVAVTKVSVEGGEVSLRSNEADADVRPFISISRQA
jgi:hypothetical protein